MCLCAEGKWHTSLTLLYGLLKVIRIGIKGKGKTRGGIWNECKNWGLLALDGNKLPALQHDPHVELCRQDCQGQLLLLHHSQHCHSGDLSGWMVLLCLWEAPKGSVPQIWGQEAAFQTGHCSRFFLKGLGLCSCHLWNVWESRTSRKLHRSIKFLV